MEQRHDRQRREHGTLTLASASVSQNASEYRAVFTNSAGSVMSSAATLTVNYIGPVSPQPQSVTVDEGGTATLTAGAPASPVAGVQWQVSADGGNTWSNITGATATTLTLSSVTRAQNTDQYRAVFTNTVGSLTSAAATLTVDWIGPVSTQPQSATVTSGQSASFTAAVNANPAASVQWQVSTNGGTTWTNDTADSGATTATLTIASASAGVNAYEYQAVFTNAGGSVSSSAATLTVSSAAILTLGPASAGPDPLGGQQTLTAMLTDSSANPLPGQTVTLTVTGVNPQTLSAVTDSNGNATFTYSGSATGQDTAVASYAATGGGSVSSSPAEVAWSSQLEPVVSTPVHGNFFAAGSASGFSAQPGQTPAFGQTFPNINFNPLASCCIDAAHSGAGLSGAGQLHYQDAGPISGSHAIGFDGQTGDLATSDPSAGNTTGAGGVSIEAWIKPVSVSPTQSIAYKAYLYEFDVSHGQLRLLIGNGSSWIDNSTFFVGGNIIAGVWQHVAGSYDATTGQWALYINGSQVASGSATTGFVGANTTPLSVGGDPDAPAGYYFGGEISNVAIFPVALTARRWPAMPRTSPRRPLPRMSWREPRSTISSWRGRAAMRGSSTRRRGRLPT